MPKRIKLKSIELQNGQTLQSIIEDAKKMDVADFSKIIIDVDAFIENDYCFDDGCGPGYAVCEVKLKKIK